MQCFLDTRALKQASHQGKSLTKASKPPNSKYLLLVEVHRAESLVDEVVGPLLTGVAEERVQVGGVEGVFTSMAGSVVGGACAFVSMSSLTGSPTMLQMEKCIVLTVRKLTEPSRVRLDATPPHQPRG